MKIIKPPTTQGLLLNNYIKSLKSPDYNTDSTASFEKIADISYKNKEENKEKSSPEIEYIADFMGTTANVVYIENDYIYIANAGDSMAVMYKNKKAICLNTEHKLSLPTEESRIKTAGSRIINNRIDGKLNLSRAIGMYNLN